MEELYSVEFFLSFVESLQRHCQQFLNYNQFVEVSGFVSVEIDNVKKERYVLSELLQSSGNVVSESFCAKAFNTSENNWMAAQSPLSYQLTGKDVATQRNNESKLYSKQSKPFSRQPVFPKRSRSESQSMILPVNPVVQHIQTPSLPEENAFITQSNDMIQPRAVEHSFSIGQFNIQKPFPVKTECFSDDICVSAPQTTSVASKAKKRKHSSYSESTPLQSPVSIGNMSCSSESEVSADPGLKNQAAQSSNEILVTLPRTLSDEGQPDAAVSNPSSAEAPEVIDLDLFDDDDDEVDNMPSDSSFQEQSFSDLQSDLTLDASKFIKQCQKKVANPGSLSVLRSVLKRFKKYHFEKSGQDIDPLDTEPEQLNEMLLDFFTGAKKMDGSDLTVGSLKNTQVYMERYLKQGGYPYSITKDDRFKSSREYIKTRQESCKNKPIPKHIPVDDDDIEIMFQKNVLGASSPDSLFNTLWLLNAKYFAKKKPGEHFNMKWGDIQLKTNEAGQEYLERPIHEAFSLKLFAKPHDPDRCFVNYYKQYRDMRPKGTLDNDFAFYLKLNKNPGPGLWFLPEPIMWSPFTYAWKKIVASSGLSLNKRLL